MHLTKWDPLTELEDISNRLYRIFGRPAIPAAGGHEMVKLADWTPTVDVSETETEFLIKAELPEVKKEDIQISIEGGMLTLKGERKLEKEDQGRKFHRIERSYGSFVRSFHLPEGVDESKVKAEFKEGMVNITLPKSAQAKPKAREIPLS